MNGRRSGKSLVLGAGLAVYFATQFDYKPYLRTSPVATIPIISPSTGQATELYNGIKNMFLSSPYLYQEFLGGKLDGFNESYPEKSLPPGTMTGNKINLKNRVTIRVMAADVSTLRGIAVPFAILDECCWFGHDSNDKINTDSGIYQALAPATAQFNEGDGVSMILKISSPNDQKGLMFDNFEKRRQENILSLQAPTWYLNPTISLKYLENERKKGISYFLREYGAKFTASENAFLDPKAIDRSRLNMREELLPQAKYKYVAAMDYGSKDDYWAFSIGHKEKVIDPETKEKKDQVFIDYIEYWKGTSGSELDPSQVIPRIASKMKEYGCMHCVSDQYAFAPLKTLFHKEGVILKEFKSSMQSKVKCMTSLQIAFNSDAIKIVDKPLAFKQLRTLMQKRSRGGVLRVEHANGAHDDIVDAIALVNYHFDRHSPLFIGIPEDDPDFLPIENKDLNGNFISAPTAADLAEHTGNHKFEDNLLKKKLEESDDDDSSFWFSF